MEDQDNWPVVTAALLAAAQDETLSMTLRKRLIDAAETVDRLCAETRRRELRVMRARVMDGGKADG